MATSLEKSKKAQWGEQALTAVYQSWNFGEDCSVNVWATGARKSTIKKIYRKNIGNKYYLHSVLNNVTLLCTKYYQNWLMNVEDIASQSSVIFEHDWTDPFSGFVSQGSAETLVRRGGITKYHLIAYSLSNTSAKNLQNRLMCIEVIVCNVSVVFLDTVYRLLLLWY